MSIEYTLGWRCQSEVLPLEIRQVDLVEGTIRLDPGGSKSADGRLGALIVAQFLVYRESFRNTNARERRTLIRECLGVLINDGRTYLSPEASRYQLQIDEWTRRAVGDLVELLGAGYVGRFNCGPAYQVSIPPRGHRPIDVALP